VLTSVGYNWSASAVTNVQRVHHSSAAAAAAPGACRACCCRLQVAILQGKHLPGVAGRGEGADV